MGADRCSIDFFKKLRKDNVLTAETLAGSQRESLVGQTIGHYQGKNTDVRKIGQNAIAAWSRALVLRGKGKLAALVDNTFAASGFDAAVRALALQRLERLNEKKERGAYIPAMAFVTQYLRLGDREQTTAWLAKAVSERNWQVLEIGIHPRYESLRSDPQFVGLARQMGLSFFAQSALDQEP